MPLLIYISIDLATDTKISNSERLTEVDLKAFIRKHPSLSQCDAVEVLLVFFKSLYRAVYKSNGALSPL